MEHNPPPSPLKVTLFPCLHLFPFPFPHVSLLLMHYGTYGTHCLPSLVTRPKAPLEARLVLLVLEPDDGCRGLRKLCR